jgi:hypothetical protein
MQYTDVKCRNYLEQSIVKITPAGSQDTFLVHRVQLLEASDYFARALNGRFRESRDQALTLPGCSVETCQLFLYWLAKSALPDFKVACVAAREEDEQSAQQASNEAQLGLVRLWYFGEAYLMPALQNAAMRALLKILEISWPYACAVREVFLTSVKGSHLRWVFAGEITRRLNEKNTYEESDLDEFASIPGFLTVFDGVRRICHASHDWTLNCAACAPSLMKMHDAWMLRT